MSIKLLTNHLFKTLVLTAIGTALYLNCQAQEEPPSAGAKSNAIKTDSLTKNKTAGKGNELKANVVYFSKDSFDFDLDKQQVHLYGDAEIHYEEIVLKAAYVMIDFRNNTVTAEGMPDSSGQISGTPDFTEGGHHFKAKKLHYNFNTRKGLISTVITQEGDGYLHGGIIKKFPDNEINIQSGKYTTCNLEHPHYEFRFHKSKVIPDNKIVTGPAYMAVADVPTPLAIPFGLFPNHKGQRSGIIIPSYGESANRGFYFEDFGYYLGISDYVDLELKGDAFTLGSWAAKGTSHYVKRYKYDGFVNFNYAINILGVPGSVDYSSNRDFSLRWSHKQDPKARPNSRFSADVNIVSNKFNKFNPVSSDAYLTNTLHSSISYQATFNNKYFFTVSADHTQNTLQKTVSMTLPDLSFSVNRFNPFAKEERLGPERWYEKISVTYSSTAQNSINTYDSLLFKPGFSSQFKNGIQHNIAVSSPLKVAKYFIMTNSISYHERWYTQKVLQAYKLDTLGKEHDSLVWQLHRDTVFGFNAARDLAFSSSFSTTLYGLVQFKKGWIRGIRHTITPTITFSYVPGFGDQQWGYYKYYLDPSTNKLLKYSVLEGSIYGSPPDKSQGTINFGISNNLEMKVKSASDTITGTKKIPLIENFSISAYYDVARDSMRWSNLTMSGRTKLFGNLDISYASQWDPYAVDSAGNDINMYEWDKDHRLFRLKSTAWNLSLNWSLKSKTTAPAPKTDKGTPEERQAIQNHPGNYVDFNVPWSLSINYSLNYNNTFSYIDYSPVKTNTVVQTIGFTGDINITKGWKIGFRSGWDFKANQLSYTSLDFYRDLHCWEMRFNWIPIGFRKSWNFTISVKSSLLQDLKLNKKKDFLDY